MSVVACFLGFSRDDDRVLASSSFRVFLVGFGMPEIDMMKGIPVSWLPSDEPSCIFNMRPIDAVDR